jgi:hypothetical protein
LPATETRLVNIRKVGWPKGPNDIYIGRGGSGDGKWGNPFIMGKDGDRATVVARYREYLLGRKDLIEQLPSLRGKTLFCFCHPLGCHGDVLVELLNEHYPTSVNVQITR